MLSAIALLYCILPMKGALSEPQRVEIDKIIGVKGIFTAAENTHKISLPRTDLRVIVDESPLHAFMGLTSWASFTGDGDHLIITGEFALAEDEVNPVISAALDNGLDVTALHNDFVFDKPRLMYLHIGGRGDGIKLATGVRRCLDRIADIRKGSPVPAQSFGLPAIPSTSSITSAVIDQILGTMGQSNGGMYKVSIGREAKAYGQTIGNQMGLHSWAAFAGSDENALITGDIALLSAEVQSIVRILRKAGINIVAIHNHMTHEEPQFIFLHYWGKGRASDLASAIRAALDTQKR